MRSTLFLVLLGLPLAAPAAPMGYDEARVLLSRSGFAALDQEVQALAVLTRAEAVERLLGDARGQAVTPAPGWANDFIPPRRIRAMSEQERQAFRHDQREKSIELRGWWYEEMLSTPSPLTERMTLFWHNHFVSSQQKVRSPVLMYRQNVLLRRHALGSYAELLHAVSKDAAMAVYLDNASNRKGQPNENFAREVMELFTLGEGRYTEQDVKEAARAFTGWGVDRETGEFRFYPRLHDDGVKTVLGTSGRLDGADVLNLLLKRPPTAETVAAKLWCEFVSPNPPSGEVTRLAAVFRDSQYDVKSLLRTILTSDALYAPASRTTLVKSPVELIVGSLRQFDMRPPDWRPLVRVAYVLGQDLFAPPNVKGWPGGTQWINSTTLLARRQLLERLFRGQEMTARGDRATATASMGQGHAGRARMAAMRQGYRFDGDRWLAQFAGGGDRRARIARLVLAAPPLATPPAATSDAEYVAALVLDPVYQLK